MYLYTVSLVECPIFDRSPCPRSFHLVPLRDKSGLTRYPANESPGRTGLHCSISAKTSFYLPAFEISRSCRTSSDFQPMRVSEEPVCIFLFRQNPVFTFLWLRSPQSIATLLPSGLIEGHKWFFQISSQWESHKNRFALISFGKIQFLPCCIWDRPFMSYRLGGWGGNEGSANLANTTEENTPLYDCLIYKP